MKLKHADIDDDTKYVFILLTKHSDKFSLLILALIRGHYSHASIGFEEDEDRFYSFTRRGFHIEEPERISRTRKNVECALYKIPVSSHDYALMQKHLAQYHENHVSWKYDILGVLFAAIKFPLLPRKRKRFCSQFVAEVLKSGNVLHLGNKSSVVFPDDFSSVHMIKSEFFGTLEDLARHRRKRRHKKVAFDTP